MRFRVVLSSVQKLLQNAAVPNVLDQLLNAVIAAVLGVPLNAPIILLHCLPVGFLGAI